MVLSPSRSATETRAKADEVEARLMQRAAGGDCDAAIGALYDRYARRLYGYGLRLLQDVSLAEEMVQETFVRLWRSAARFDAQKGSVSRYVFTIARNTAIDLHRRKPRSERTELGDLAQEGDAFEQLLTSLTVRDALHSLQPAFREILELAYDQALSHREIAAALGVPVGTVKSRTHYAMRALRAELVDRGVHA